MSNVQRMLLALLGLSAATVVGVLLLGPAGGDEGGAGGLQLVHSVTTDRPRSGVDGETPVATLDARRSVPLANSTVVDVLVVSRNGRQVSGAEIRLTNQDGQEFSGSEVASFEDVPAGEWTLTVTASKLLTHTQAIEVIEGERHGYTVKLQRYLPIRGRVRDRFGEPFGPTIVWFLRTRQGHPMQRSGAGKRLETKVSGNGEFEIDLNKAGEYRLSVGPIGKPLATMSELRQLHAGGSQEVEIVISGGTSLEIQLEGASPALAEGKANFRVAILEHPNKAITDGYRRPFFASSGERRRETRRVKRNAKALEKNADGAGGGQRAEMVTPQGAKRHGKQKSVGHDLDPGQAVSDPPVEGGAPAPGSGRDENAWVERLSRPVPQTGNLIFDGLPAGRELKLAFLRRNERHESTTTLVLQEDRRMVVTFRVPGRLPKEQAGEVQALFVALDSPPLLEDAPEKGFHWK